MVCVKTLYLDFFAKTFLDQKSAVFRCVLVLCVHPWVFLSRILRFYNFKLAPKEVLL